MNRFVDAHCIGLRFQIKKVDKLVHNPVQPLDSTSANYFHKNHQDNQFRNYEGSTGLDPKSFAF